MTLLSNFTPWLMLVLAYIGALALFVMFFLWSIYLFTKER